MNNYRITLSWEDWRFAETKRPDFLGGGIWNDHRYNNCLSNHIYNDETWNLWKPNVKVLHELEGVKLNYVI